VPSFPVQNTGTPRQGRRKRQPRKLGYQRNGHDMLRLVERDYSGTLVEVRLPSEVRAASAGRAGERGKPPDGVDLDGVDFLRTESLRQSIHAREGGLCFYCLRRTHSRARCLDHVVPRARFGSNSYRNLVSCCIDCNLRKQELPAEDFLRQLFRDGRNGARLEG